MPAVGKAWGSHRNSDTCQVNASKPLELGRQGGLVPPSGVEPGEDGWQRVEMGRSFLSEVWDQARGALTDPAEKAPGSQQEVGYTWNQGPVPASSRAS